MDRLKFEKYEGLGNDFLVIEAGPSTLPDVARVRRLCDRHFGVGGDGVLVVAPPVSPRARASMIVLNSDGSRPEGCGNGLRCVALYLALRDGGEGSELVIDTDAGPRQARVERKGSEALVTVTMGRGSELGEHPLAFRDRELRFTLISTGNPHAIAFDTGLDEAALDALGPEVSKALPGGSNVELVTTRGPREFDVIVWERGVGRTLACGTGAAATAVAAARSGRAPFASGLLIRLPGGPLEVTVEQASLDVTLRGPARRVFSGEVSLG